ARSRARPLGVIGRWRSRRGSASPSSRSGVSSFVNALDMASLQRPALAGAEQSAGQVPGNGHVDANDTHAYDGDPLRQLIELQRDEGSRDDDREIFRPSLSQEEAGAFREHHGGIEEGPHANRLQPAIIQ